MNLKINEKLEETQENTEQNRNFVHFKHYFVCIRQSRQKMDIRLIVY